jgi:hypothetical protein
MVKGRIAVMVGAAVVALSAAAAHAAPVLSAEPHALPAQVPGAAFDSSAVDDPLLDASFAPAPMPPAVAAAAAAVPRAAVPRDEHPFYSYLLSAGEDVLQLGSAPKQQAAAPVSAVPLPGAIWLFGSALVAFLCIAGRRRL